MKNIFKLNLFENKTEEIALFNSALTRKLDSMGLEPKDVIMKVCSECPKDEESEGTVKADLTRMVASGFMFNGVIVEPFMAGASDARKATSTWIDSTIIPELGKWAMCGLQTKNMKLAINKYMAYIGLLSSASKPFIDVFGNKIDIRRVAIIKDTDVTVEAIVDLVSMKEVQHKVNRTLTINALDGFGIVRASLTKGESVTIRGPWLKAFCQATNWSKLFGFAINHGKKSFTDLWGNERRLKDVDMILTESCFKTAKLYESWEQYCNAFEELGHEIAVCVREHAPKLKGLPYQQVQTLTGNRDDALSFAAHAKKTVYKYRLTENAVNLLYGDHAKAAKMYPLLFKEGYTKRTIQEKYTTKRNDMLGGRIPELGYNAFLAPDIVAFAEHLFGLPIKGFLKAGECYCSNIKEGLVDVTRNPHLDNAHVLLKNVKHLPMAEGPTMFINIWDTTTIQLRADYDGDHVWYSQDEHLLNLVEATYNELKNIPVDWDVDKAPKSNITRSAINQFIINLIHGSEIGLYADALTKMWNQKYDRNVCDWLTYAANVLIDAAKHASVKIEKPQAVKDLNMVSLPMFAMYAKADADHPANSDHWLKERVTESGLTLPPRCAESGSFADMYSGLIKSEIPETLELENLEDEIFDFTKLMFDPHRKVGKFEGLARKGSYNPETCEFENSGLFQQIAFRHSTEWNRLVGDASFFQNRREWEEETAKKAREEIIEWAKSKYPECEGMDSRMEDACYDIIVRNIFTTRMSDGMDTVVKQAFWRIYGHKAIKALKQNLNTEIPDFDSEEYEELLSDD